MDGTCFKAKVGTDWDTDLKDSKYGWKQFKTRGGTEISLGTYFVFHVENSSLTNYTLVYIVS